MAHFSAFSRITLLGAFALPVLVQQSYLELFRLPPQPIPQEAIDAYRRELETRRKAEERRLEKQADGLSAQEDAARKQLEAMNREASFDTVQMSSKRQDLHCAVRKTEQALRNNRADRKFGLAERYAIAASKLDLAQRWPPKKKEIDDEVAAGRGRDRKHGDVDDIGIRKVGEGQDKDIKLGLDGIREMRGQGLMPADLADPSVGEYIQKLAQRIATNSDLKVPVHASVLATREINSFALPGGFVFLTAGLIGSAGNENELAGVIGHEIAHAAARHGNKLVRGISVRNVVTEGAQMAANVFTGGATGTATHYVREYGIFGLGMALNLKLLGVNSENEAEADQLGIQYVWRAGYDPKGLLRFFDKLAGGKGAAALEALSFFHTHPAYSEALMTTFSELEYLPPKTGAIENARAFRAAHEAVRKRLASLDEPAGPGPVPECGAVGRPRTTQRFPRHG